MHAPPGSGTVPVTFGQIAYAPDGLQRGGAAGSLRYRYGGKAGTFSASQLAVARAGPRPPVAGTSAVVRAQQLAGPNSPSLSLSDWGTVLQQEATAAITLSGIVITLGGLFPQSAFSLGSLTAAGFVFTPLGEVAAGAFIGAAAVLRSGWCCPRWPP